MGSSSPEFVIPPKYQNDLTFSPCKDDRSDDAILAQLNTHQPVTSEKNLWAFWHSGITSMPGWCRRNVAAWARINGPDWTIRVLDSQSESPNYFLNFVPASTLPAAFVNGTMDGEYSGPHSADLLRGACIHLHGGIFMDVGCVLVRSLDRVCWDKLADPASPYQVGVPLMYGITTANHLVAGRKNDPFIKKWHDLFVHVWGAHTNSQGLAADPLVAFAQSLSFDESRANKFHWDFKVPAQTVFEYITQVVCWMRVCMLSKDEGDGFVGVEYWRRHVLIWDVLSEAWGGEETLGFKGAGKRMFELLKLPLDTDPSSDEYQDAERLVWRLLTRSSMQKITRGKGLTNDLALGLLWDENEGADCGKGTFAELLRYGCENFRQERKEIEYLEAPEPPERMDKGLLEP